MSIYLRAICLICVLFTAAILADAQTRTSGTNPSVGYFRSLSDREVQLLIADALENNPTLRERLADPEIRQGQLENLKELLAFAAQAVKNGLADEKAAKAELANIRNEVVAVSYDKRLAKEKPERPTFGYVSELKIRAFWAAKTNEAEFDEFLEAKLASLGPDSNGAPRTATEGEIAQAKEFFAKMRIREAEYKAQKALLPRAFTANLDLQVKLQQAQFLARLFAQEFTQNIAASEAEIDEYIAAHPELDTSKKKAAAEEVLRRALSGEDFAKLANEFSEDPGNTSPTGAKVGGIYKNVLKGVMVATFEAGALVMEAGQVNPKLVETDFGYHIVKLEKKGPAKDDDGKETITYDVRHILFSTGVKDTTNPNGRDIPIRQYVKAKIETERESEFLAKVVAENDITVPLDFVVPPAKTAPAVTGRKPMRRPIRKRK